MNIDIIITIIFSVLLAIIAILSIFFAVTYSEKKDLERTLQDCRNMEDKKRLAEQEEKNRENKPVSCETCRCLLNRVHAYKVHSNLGDEFFCQNCRPDYKTKIFDFSTSKTLYYKELQVDINGEPIGYKKK